MNVKTTPTVLISGAGVAGPTVAYWLARHGFRPTVVERAAGLRTSGSPVDVRGPAVQVAERMGVMERLRQAATDATATSFVNRSGREVGRVNSRALQRAAGSQEVELTRTDLAAILYQASRGSAEYVFGDTMTALNQDGGGVDVAFEKAAPRRFDLVIGADGLHSTTRRLAFGPESEFVRHGGLYVATLPLNGPAGHQRDIVIYNAPAGWPPSTPSAAAPWPSSSSASRPWTGSTLTTSSSTSRSSPTPTPAAAGACRSC
jgi:2-polyprenyl-6-methoxyphenol hydroxylase-like FAD-dependent oxidoreductase